MMTKNMRNGALVLRPLLRGVLLVPLALAVLGGGSLAADLFNDYTNCPYRFRLREDAVFNLVAVRDTAAENVVHVSWAMSNPATWNLGDNAFRTSLVVILDDRQGHPAVVRKLPLSTRQTTFHQVATGHEVEVQLALIVDTEVGSSYVISKILEQRLPPSLSKPSFTGAVMRVTAADNASTSADEFRTERVPHGIFYYVGYDFHCVDYGHSFTNYKADAGSFTCSVKARLRMGLAHSANESQAVRRAVGFESYRLRISDADGDDVLPEGSVPTMVNQADEFLLLGTATSSLAGNTVMFNNVRINDDGRIYPSLWKLPNARLPFNKTNLFTPLEQELSTVNPPPSGTRPEVHSVYVAAPDEHRYFPLDILDSDEAYQFTAWAVDKHGDIISPGVSLKMYPTDSHKAIQSISELNPNTPKTVFQGLKMNGNSGIYTTEFTVLK